MDAFWNAVQRRAGQMDAQQGQPRFATVESYDPHTGAAQVTLQPEGVLSGWLPVLSMSVGASWGMHVPLSPGDQVFVIPHEGHANHGVIVGRVFSDAAQPPDTSGADVVLRSKAGAIIKLMSNGEAVVTDPSGTTLTFSNNGTLTLQGNLHVTGDIVDRDGAHGSFNDLRADYDAHRHPGVQPGSSSTSATDHPTS